VSLEHIVSMPKKLNVESAIKVSNELNMLCPDRNLCVDFERTYFFPFGMLLFGAAMRRVITKFKKSGYEVTIRNHKRNDYPHHMGFYESFGAHVGKKVGEAKGSQNYIPITVRNTSEIRDKARRRCLPVGEIVEEDANQIASVLVREGTGGIFEVIAFTLRELIRNVIEHSESDDLWYVAQYWKADGHVEFVLLDSGIGIQSSLNQNPDYEIKNDSDAIKMAIMPSVSSKVRRSGTKKAQPYDDYWENSGYGLYLVSRFCETLGSLVILSGITAQYQDCEGNEKTFEASHKGTVVRIVFDTNRISLLKPGFLKGFLEDGEKIAGRELIGSGKTASRASKQLRTGSFPPE